MNKIVDGLDGLDGLRSTECFGMRLYRKKRMNGMNAIKSTTFLLIEFENWWLWWLANGIGMLSNTIFFTN